MEESTEYQEMSRYKPHVLLTQENTQIKDLKHENRGKTALVSSKCLAFLKGIPDSTLCAVHRALALSGGAPVCFRADHGSIPKADASADDGKERAGYQTRAQPSPGPCQGARPLLS